MIARGAGYINDMAAEMLNANPSIAESSTRELVILAAAGDAAAFETLVMQYKNVVCSIALAIVRDVEAGEEVAQEVFVSAWQRLPKLSNPVSFLPWIRQMTRNRANDFLRRKVRARNLFTRSEPPTPGSHEITTAATADPREKLVRDEELEVLRDAFEKLPDETREILTLYYRENNSVRQVAVLLDLTEDTVKKRLSRGRASLRGEMEAAFADGLRRNAPGAAFTAGVIAAINFGAPLAGTAAGAGAAKAAGSAAGSAAAVWAGAIGGLACGLAAIVFSLRLSLAKAWDEDERRGLRRIAWVEAAVLVTFIGIIAGGWNLKEHPVAALSLVAGYWVSLNAVILIGMRRVTRRRREIQKVEEPEAWLAEERRNRWGIVLSIAILITTLFGLGMAFHCRSLQ